MSSPSTWGQDHENLDSEACDGSGTIFFYSCCHQPITAWHSCASLNVGIPRGVKTLCGDPTEFSKEEWGYGRGGELKTDQKSTLKEGRRRLRAP